MAGGGHWGLRGKRRSDQEENRANKDVEVEEPAALKLQKEQEIILRQPLLKSYSWERGHSVVLINFDEHQSDEEQRGTR